MIRIGIAALLTVLAFPQANAGQDQSNHAPGSELFLLRVHKTTMHGHEVSECYLLLPNGRYRREHWEEQPVVGKSIVNPAERFKTYVFEGQLTPAEVESVSRFVHTPAFGALRQPAQLRMSSEFLSVAVVEPRKRPHTFMLSASADYKPNRAALDPLFSWMKQMSKRKGDVSQAEANRCRLPKAIDFGAETIEVHIAPLPTR